MGEIERPRWRRFQSKENPEKHIALLRIDIHTKEQFVKSVEAQPGKSGLVFVHGFDVSFAAAARRTAQIAYDLGFDGPAFFFSWPSKAELSAAGYRTDETNVDWATSDLVEFLRVITATARLERVHVIAHSMGNRALVSAILKLAQEPQPGRAHIHEVILTAPDIDADVFVRDILPVPRNVGRITMYSSSRDLALWSSKSYHGGYRRAGDSEGTVTIAPGVDTIDASAVDTDLGVGHSYYAENRSVLPMSSICSATVNRRISASAS